MGIFNSLTGFGRSPESVEKWRKEQMTDDEKKLCGYVKSKVEEVRSFGARVAAEGIWMTNIAYLLGYSNLQYDTAYRNFRPSNQGDNFARRGSGSSVNQILPTTQNRLARLCKNPPKYDVRPESMTQEDKDRARENLEILNSLWEQNGVNLNTKRIELLQWVQQCGHAYVKISWDDTLGKPMIDPIDGRFLGYEGDIRADICSAFEIFPDPLAKTLDEATWVIQAKVRKLDYFRSHYPDRGDEVKEEGAWLLSVQNELRVNAISSAGPLASASASQMKNAAIELSYYEKRSKQHPGGRHVVCANGILLKNDELAFGEIPFSKFDDILVSGKYYPESIITHLRPLQDQLNKLLNQRYAWSTALLKGKYIAAKGHALIAESINDNITEIVEYTHVPGAEKPSAMNIPNIPQYAYNEEDSIMTNFNQIAGIGEVSKGEMPGANVPAIGMQLLQEQDETRIGIETESNEHNWARVGRHLLLCARKQYEMTRVRKKAGPTGEYVIKEFSGQDIIPDPDVVVVKGSTLPSSKTLKRQDLVNLLNMGLLGDPADPVLRERVLGQMEYGDLAEVWIDQSIDNNQIRKTIKQIEEGTQPEVNELDNHKMHIQMKNRYRKSDKFEQLSPESQALMLADIDAHLEWEVQLTTDPAALAEPDPAQAVAEADAAEEQMALANPPMDESQIISDQAPIEQVGIG